jgi:hypothetical protein
MDTTDEYKLLPKESTIEARSIIPSELGRLYFTENIVVKEGEVFKPPIIFVTAILERLSRLGLLKN